MKYFLHNIKNHQPCFRRFILTMVVILITIELCQGQASSSTDSSSSAAPGGPGAPTPSPGPAGANATSTIRPWLRICQGKEHYNLVGSKCAGGYMFERSFPSGTCVCGNGIWILKSGYCDTLGKTYVLFADGNDCFKINSQIRWIRYVGHPERSKLDSNYIVSGDWDYIETLNRIGPSRQLISKIVWTMAVGDQPDNVYLSDEKLCFKSEWRPLSSDPKEDGRPFVRIGKSVVLNDQSNRYSSPTVHQAQRLSYCPYFAKEEQTVWISGGGMLVTDRTTTRFYQERPREVYGSCNIQPYCSNVPPFVDQDESLTRVPGAPTPAPNVDIGIPDYPIFVEDFRARINKDIETILEEPTEVAANGVVRPKKVVCPKSADDYSKETDKQTVRMIRGQAAWSLKQIRTPPVVLSEYNYLQKASKILREKCSGIPEALVSSFLRMFRFALSESLQNHPYKQQGDAELFKRINKSLDACSAESDPANKIIFKYTDTCPKNFTYMEYKVKKPADELRNCSDERPKHLRFSPCEHDLVLDVAWKSILFAHYFCARHFAEYFDDQSSFYTAMERLFNPDMMGRYYNPGRSYDGMKYVFQMYNLESFITNLDRCLACARSVSQYRRWLRRPKDLKMCPMNGNKNPPNAYNFEKDGFTPINKNPIYLPSVTTGTNKNTYKCYNTWLDGLYTRPRENVPESCQLNLHVLGQTATYA